MADAVHARRAGQDRARHTRGSEIQETPHEEIREKVRQANALANRQDGRLRFITGNCIPACWIRHRKRVARREVSSCCTLEKPTTRRLAISCAVPLRPPLLRAGAIRGRRERCALPADPGGAGGRALPADPGGAGGRMAKRFKNVHAAALA